MSETNKEKAARLAKQREALKGASEAFDADGVELTDSDLQGMREIFGVAKVRANRAQIAGERAKQHVNQNVGVAGRRF